MLTTPTLLNKVDLRKYNNSLSTAIADSDLVGKTLVVTEAVTCGNVTIPDTIALEILNGGSISVNDGSTLSVNGPYDSCVETPFLGSGNVVINSPVKNNNHDNLTGTSVHGLGTASTADVTTSATDTTPGRLLKVGDFGIGQNCVFVPVGTNLNDLTINGFYMGDKLVNAPTTGWCYIEVFNHGGAGYTYQRAISVTESIPVVYERTSTAGIWQSWSRQINQENILTSGKPTVSLERNAIIERGSNANGEYVKFADGTLICTCYPVNITLSATVGLGTNILRVFPVAFDLNTSTQYMWNVIGSGSDGCCCGFSENSNLQVTLWATPLINSSTSQTVYVCFSAIGRWF